MRKTLTWQPPPVRMATFPAHRPPGMPPFLTSTVVSQSQWTVPTSSFSGTSPYYTNPYNDSNQYNYAVKHVGQPFFTATNGGSDTAPNFSPRIPRPSMTCRCNSCKRT